MLTALAPHCLVITRANASLDIMDLAWPVIVSYGKSRVHARVSTVFNICIRRSSAQIQRIGIRGTRASHAPI